MEEDTKKLIEFTPFDDGNTRKCDICLIESYAILYNRKTDEELCYDN